MIGKLGKPSVSIIDKTKNIATAFVIKLIWVLMILGFLKELASADLLMQLMQISDAEPEFIFFMACVWAPVWEETVFRWAPITVAKRINPELLWPVIIISSAIFGWGHGNGPFSLLIQGMGGIILSCLYLKNNNSLLSGIILHSMWNTFVIFIL